jgi:hypothetical protein
MLATGGRPALLRPAALLALAAAWLCAPAALRASCGDYVILDPRPAAPALAHQSPDPPSPAVPARPPAPCHGPRCSGGSLPPLLPLTVAPDVPEQWGHLPLPRPASDPGRFAARSDEGLRRLPGNVPPVYHPPRLGPVSAPLA